MKEDEEEEEEEKNTALKKPESKHWESAQRRKDLWK